MHPLLQTLDLTAGTGMESSVQDLHPTRQPILIHTLPASVSATGEAVRVRILIGEDGVPTQALFLSGPAYLRDKALKTAYEWRFEPLGPHGLKAPLPLTLTFQPRQSAAH